MFHIIRIIFHIVRLLLAGIFVYGATLATFGALNAHFGERMPWWAMPLPGIAMMVSLALASFVFNRSGFRPSLRRQSLDEYIAGLEAKGKLLRQPFHATRAFAVEEFEDEGLHYYLELSDGRVLYLTGQYLYDYEPITDDPELNQARAFPCTEFQVLRHKDAGYAFHILCAGVTLEPEITAPAFTREDFRRELVPEDGKIITNKSYEELKRERTSAIE